MTGMKDQYFGVEVEMTGITREQAAQALADYFGTIPQYKGGVYDAWVVKDTENKEWKLMSDGSIRAERKTLHGYEQTNNRQYKVEMVSPKLTYAELPKFQECVRQIRHAGAKVNSSCGLHIHVDAANHNRIDVTAEGDILVSGRQGFAWVTADGTQRDPHTGTSTDAVNCAALDTEGNVWLASSNEGLLRYSPGCFASPNLAAGLTDLDINAVTAAGGRYYAAVNQGLLAFDSDWQPVSNKLTQALAGIHVQSLMVDSRGRLWCGTYSELGLVRYDTGSGELTFFNQSNGLGSTRIRVAFELRDGTVAVGTQDGLALIRGDEVAAFYDKDNGLETQSILCIVQAPDGTLLAGSTGSGIYALAQDGSITKFSYEQGLEDGVVLRILQEEDGRSAFVSAGSHLYYWAGRDFPQAGRSAHRSRLDLRSLRAGRKAVAAAGQRHLRLG